MKLLKDYADYKSYINEQKEKTCDPKRIAKWETRLAGQTKTFIERFKPFNFKNGSEVLCVGARLNAEGGAFHALGCDAIAIDIVPNPKYNVIEMDMHDMKFQDNFCDIIFSNVLDHSLYPERFAQEAHRVLRPNGLMLIDIFVNQNSQYEVIDVTVDGTIKLFTDFGFGLLEKRHPIKKMYKSAKNEYQFLFRNIK